MFSLAHTFFAIILISFCSTEKHYECGPHGRFEYCIDGFPACVIGCHCHPGYYFDTDSKICEPNVKLAHQYRRMPEVSLISTPLLTTITPTPTPKSNLDKKVDEIAKDTDDLGDWLYNQFFKTIETQVINSTNNDKPNELTRRSNGNSTFRKKSTRKRRKSRKHSKKKKNKNSLRKKLLQITEDDSLFDSDSSESTSNEDSSSCSASVNSDTSSNSEPDKDDKIHGHRKIIIFNKKPTLPLPSFIFLPHMDTPYYPPIGLPPPPMLPMLPMLPVPPVAPMPPFFATPPQFGEGENNGTPSTSNATNNTVTVTTETTIHITAASEPSESYSNNRSPDPPDVTPNSNIRSGKRSGKGHGRSKSKNALRSKFDEETRDKFMHDLREKIMRKNKISLMHQFEDREQEESPLITELTSSQEIYALTRNMQLQNMADTDPKLKDVDFKYLSELIHRANLNQSNQIPPHQVVSMDHLNERMVNAAQAGRRNYAFNEIPSNAQRPVQKPRNLQTSESENSFYSNIGRQIASMIRNIDAKSERQVNIEIERTKPEIIPHPILNENRYPSHSYWERSVRSPLHYFKDEIVYKSLSNEKLLSLENEIENVASTSPTLTLQELENIINTMNKAQFQIRKKAPSGVHHPSNRSLNVNLLPKSENGSRLMNNFSYYNKPVRNDMHSITNVAHIAHNSYMVNTVSFNEITTEQTTTNIPSGFWVFDSEKTALLRGIEKNTPVLNKNPVYSVKPTRKLISRDDINSPSSIIPKSRRIEYLTFLNTVPHRSLPSTTPKTPDMKNAQIINYKSLKYHPVSLNNNMQRPMHPHYLTSFSRAINKPVQENNRKPSYFHHELHHFDYFE